MVHFCVSLIQCIKLHWGWWVVDSAAGWGCLALLETWWTDIDGYCGGVNPPSSTNNKAPNDGMAKV